MPCKKTLPSLVVTSSIVFHFRKGDHYSTLRVDCCLTHIEFFTRNLECPKKQEIADLSLSPKSLFIREGRGVD